MRTALLLALLAAATQPGGCGSAPSTPYDPCDGKACGEACHVCAPGAAGCVETAELKACTADGLCVTVTTACPMGPSGPCEHQPICDPTRPCYGRKCGDTCRACPPGDPSCVETAIAKACTADGVCVPVGQYCPSGPGGACVSLPGCGS